MRLFKHGADTHDETDHGNWARGKKKYKDLFSSKPKPKSKKSDPTPEVVASEGKRFDVLTSEGKSYMTGAAPGTADYKVSEARAKYRRATDIKGALKGVRGEKRKKMRQKAISDYESALKDAGKWNKENKAAIAYERDHIDKHYGPGPHVGVMSPQSVHGGATGGGKRKSPKNSKEYERTKRRVEMRRKAAARDESRAGKKAIEENAVLINRRLRAHYKKFEPGKNTGKKKAERLANQKKLAQRYAAFQRGTRKTDPTESFAGTLTKQEITAAIRPVRGIFERGKKVQSVPKRGSITAGSKRVWDAKGGGWVKEKSSVKEKGNTRLGHYVKTKSGQKVWVSDSVSEKTVPGMGKYKYVRGKRVPVGTADKTTIDPAHYDQKARRVKPTGKVKRKRK